MAAQRGEGQDPPVALAVVLILGMLVAVAVNSANLVSVAFSHVGSTATTPRLFDLAIGLGLWGGLGVIFLTVVVVVSTSRRKFRLWGLGIASVLTVALIVVSQAVGRLGVGVS